MRSIGNILAHFSTHHLQRLRINCARIFKRWKVLRHSAKRSKIYFQATEPIEALSWNTELPQTWVIKPSKSSPQSASAQTKITLNHFPSLAINKLEKKFTKNWKKKTLTTKMLEKFLSTKHYIWKYFTSIEYNSIIYLSHLIYYWKFYEHSNFFLATLNDYCSFVGRKIFAYSTWDSQAVSDPSTNQAQRCLTWQIGRDVVLSTWYGRKH